MSDKSDFINEEHKRSAKRVEHLVKLTNELAPMIVLAASSIEYGDVLARLHIDLCDDKRPASLLYGNSLGWMHDKLVGYSIPQVVKEIRAIYDKMIEHGFVGGKKFDWNDLNDKITVMRTEYPKVMTLESQSFKWIVIFTKGWENTDDINVYRMYEVPVEGRSIFTEPKEGESHIAFAQRTAEQFVETYTDNVEGAWYVHRPDYSWFESRGFDPDKIEDRNTILPLIKYRAFSHVVYNEAKSGRSDGAIDTYYNIFDIRRFFMETETALLAIEEEPDFQK